MGHLGIYVHIPFCARKCAYCDFASWANRACDMERYAETVCAEIKTRAAETGHPAADTVFFGGGTPSLLPPMVFAKLARCIRENFDIQANAEWTVECNPGTLSTAFAETMASCGVNRVSMGMQAAQEHLLRRLGRIHTREDVEASAAILRRAGIAHFNLDLMLGLPGQTLADVEESVRAAVKLGAEHISCYALILEEGTPLYHDYEQGKLTLPGEELERSMYGRARALLREKGFLQYEISNFARPGCECRHNVNCWQREDYLGFGCAAHGLYRNERRANVWALDAYLAGEKPEIERISLKDAMFESLMLGLRLTQGISEADFYRRHGAALWDEYGAGLSRAVKDGRLQRENGRIYLTEHGMDVMNSVLLEVM